MAQAPIKSYSGPLLPSQVISQQYAQMAQQSQLAATYTEPAPYPLAQTMEKFFAERNELAKEFFLSKLSMDYDSWTLHSNNNTDVHLNGPKGWKITIDRMRKPALVFQNSTITHATQQLYEVMDPVTMGMHHLIQNVLERELCKMREQGTLWKDEELTSPEYPEKLNGKI